MFGGFDLIPGQQNKGNRKDTAWLPPMETLKKILKAAIPQSLLKESSVRRSESNFTEGKKRRVKIARCDVLRRIDQTPGQNDRHVCVRYGD